MEGGGGEEGALVEGAWFLPTRMKWTEVDPKNRTRS